MKILMVTHRLPYAPNRGDRIRAYYMLRFLSKRADVHLLSLVNDQDEASQATSCPAASVRTVTVPYWRNRAAAVVALPTKKPLTHVLLNGRALQAEFVRAVEELQPDVVLAYCTGIAHLSALLPRHIPLVLDMVDVDSLKWEQLSPTARPILAQIYARESRCLRAFEREVVRRAAATFVVNDRERDALWAQVPDMPIQVVPNGIDLSFFRPATGPATKPSAIFCGVLDYPPNEQAALWLGQDIWPLVRSQVPDAQLTLLGSNPTRRVLRLATTDRSIAVTGSVPDTRPYLWDAAVSVAPLLTARGVQNKVLEALAARLPVVTTMAVLRGLPDGARPGCIAADSATDVAAAIARLLAQTPEERRAFADQAVLEQLSWDRQFAPLAAVLADLCQEQTEDIA